MVEVIDKFYLPEIHDYIVPVVIDFIYRGNNQLKDVSCHLIAKIMKY